MAILLTESPSRLWEMPGDAKGPVALVIVAKSHDMSHGSTGHTEVFLRPLGAVPSTCVGSVMGWWSHGHEEPTPDSSGRLWRPGAAGGCLSPAWSALSRRQHCSWAAQAVSCDVMTEWWKGPAKHQECTASRLLGCSPENARSLLGPTARLGGRTDAFPNVTS